MTLGKRLLATGCCRAAAQGKPESPRRTQTGRSWKSLAPGFKLATFWLVRHSLQSMGRTLSTHLEVCWNLLQVTCDLWRQVVVEQLGVLLADTLVDITGDKKPKRDKFGHLGWHFLWRGCRFTCISARTTPRCGPWGSEWEDGRLPFPGLASGSSGNRRQPWH